MLPFLSVDCADWAASYKRLNKANKTKNLRCFPTCAHAGHNDRGFCGSAVTVHVSGPLPGGMSIVGKLTLVSEPTPARLDMTDPLLLTGVVKGGKCEFSTFGWNYPWTANRATCKALHTFRIFLVTVDGAVLTKTDSKPFVVTSSRGEKKPSSRSSVGEDDVDEDVDEAAAVAPAVAEAAAPAKRFQSLSSVAASVAAAATMASWPSPPPLPTAPLGPASLSRSSSFSPTEVQSVQAHPVVHSDVMLIFKAMHERVVGPNDDEDGPAEDRGSLAAMSVDDMSSMALSWSDASETKLLEFERLDAILSRIFTQARQWYRSVARGPNFYLNLSLMLDRWLQERESTTLAKLANDVRGLLKLHTTSAVSMAFPLPLDHSKYALSAARVVSQFAQLTDVFILGGVNDVTGVWIQSEAFEQAMEMQRVMLGFTFVERELLNEVDQEYVDIVISAPDEMRVRKLGRRSLSNHPANGLVLKCHCANYASSYLQPEFFPTASLNVTFMFPTVNGLGYVTFYPGQNRRRVAVTTKPSYGNSKLFSCMLLQAQTGPDDWTTELEFRNELTRIERISS